MNVEFKRQTWSTNDPVAQVWIDDFVWTVLSSIALEKKEQIEVPQIATSGTDFLSLLHQVLRANQILGAAHAVYGERLLNLPSIGAVLVDEAKKSAKRSDILIHELNWLVSPKLGTRILAIEAAGVRHLYARLSEKSNPRHIEALTIWAPTLDAREELGELLRLGSYKPLPTTASDGSIYRYEKATEGLVHHVEIRSVLWPSSKNWATDIERSIWDRAQEDKAGRLKLDSTDLLTLTIRQFAVDSLLGSAAYLADILRILISQDDNLDWQRLRGYKNQLGKCEWLWATFYAVDLFEKKAGIGLKLPTWIREELVNLRDSFWPSFVQSRLLWACPDAKLGEFARAYAKLTRGT